MKIISLRTSLIVAAVFLCTFRAAAIEGACVIVNEGVPVSSLSADALRNVYTGKTMYWDGGQSIVIVVLSDKTNDAALKEASGMEASAFRTFWQRLTFSGRGQQPKKVEDTAALITLVSSTKGAIALVPADADLKGVKKIEIK